jgi:hypothetical protein
MDTSTLLMFWIATLGMKLTVQDNHIGDLWLYSN